MTPWQLGLTIRDTGQNWEIQEHGTLGKGQADPASMALFS